MSKYIAAVVQAGSYPDEPLKSASKTADMIREAASRGARLAVFPEAFIGGFPKGAHGKIHNVGIEDLWFQLRRSGSNDLVRCDFREALYSEVHEACNRRNALVYVHGLITARRVDQQVTEMRAEKLKVAPSLSDEQYRAFFGADPEYTGNSSSEEFIERNRYEH
jgi:hypothetical protein